MIAFLAFNYRGGLVGKASALSGLKGGGMGRGGTLLRILQEGSGELGRSRALKALDVLALIVDDLELVR